jgi:hypothetical protein
MQARGAFVAAAAKAITRRRRVDKSGFDAYARWRAQHRGLSMAAAEQRVAQVKAMCQIARGCAQVIAVGDLSDPRYEYEKETYQKRKLRAIQITKLIEDRFHFETALHSIIDLCVAANEMDDAGKLFKMISVDAIRQSILQAHPMLERPA